MAGPEIPKIPNEMPTEGGPENIPIPSLSQDVIEVMISINIEEKAAESGLIVSNEKPRVACDADNVVYSAEGFVNYLSFKADLSKYNKGVEDPQGVIERHYEFFRAGQTVDGFTAHTTQLRCHGVLKDGSRSFETVYINMSSKIPDVKGPEIAPSRDRVLEIIKGFIKGREYKVETEINDEYGLFFLEVSVPQENGDVIEYTYTRKNRKTQEEYSSAVGPNLTPAIHSCTIDPGGMPGVGPHDYNF